MQVEFKQLPDIVWMYSCSVCGAAVSASSLVIHERWHKKDD